MDDSSLNTILQTFQLTTEATGSSVFIFDYEKQSILLPESVSHHWGFSTETTGVPYETANSGIVADESIREYIRIHEAIMHGSQKAEGKVQLVGKNGETHLYSLKFRALLDDNGNPTGKAAGIYTNISDFDAELNRHIAINHQRNTVYREISDILAYATDLKTGVTGVLAYLGNYLQASRVYIYERDADDPDLVACTFDWYASGSSSPKHMMRKLSETNINDDALFAKSPVHCFPDISQLTGDSAAHFNKFGVKACMHLGIFDKGVFSGLIGIDDCTRARPDWAENTDDQYALSFVANLLSSYLIKERNLLRLSVAQKRLSAQQKDLTERLSSVLNSVKGGLVICRNKPEYPILYISESVARLQGYETDELMELTRRKAVNNILLEDRKRVSEEMEDQIHEYGEHSVKFRVKHRDGHEIWISCYGRVVSFQKYDEALLYCIYQDITEQELARQQLISEKKTFREAIIQNSLFNLVFDVTDNSITEDLVFPNGKKLSDRGFTLPASFDDVAKQIVSSSRIRILTPGGDTYLKSSVLVQKFQSGVTTDNIEFYSAKSDHYYRLRPLLSENPSNGHIICFCSCYDITEEKKEEESQKEALRTALEAAERANRSKTVFLNNMSHDIRTPMNAIIGYSQMARKDKDDPRKLEEHLAKIESNGKYLLDLINDVLDMSRIEAGKLNITESAISLRSVMTALTDMIKPQAEEKKLTFTSDLTGIKNDQVRCDGLHLSQVLTNCLSNSLKFTPTGGNVSLTFSQLTEEDSGDTCRYRFEVADTGIGMSKEFQKRIFEPFERAQTTTVSGIQGTGLGMSICKNLVDLMNGTITVESEEGQGTRFIIEMTLKYADEEDVLSDSATPHHGDTKETAQSLQGVRVLLVEDNPMNLEIAVDLLSDTGAEITTAINGREAVEAVKTSNGNAWDVILMDIQMPEMDGYTATRCIRALPDATRSEIPIIAMTANVFEEDRQLALQSGMNDHVTKPIDIESVVAAIRKII